MKGRGADVFFTCLQNGHPLVHVERTPLLMEVVMRLTIFAP